MAIIEIENMEFFGKHGCFAEEKVIGNKFMVSLTMETDADTASISDDITDAVNYQTAYNIVKAEMIKPSNLLEHVARCILDALFGGLPGVNKATVKVSKINPPMGGKIEKVSVILSKQK